MKRLLLHAVVLVAAIALSGCDSGDEGGSESVAVCTPQEKACDGDDVVKCNSAGTDWAFFKGCEAGCAAGDCISTDCEPACGGKACGTDGCGGTCGSCLAGEQCVGGLCVPEGCTPDCAGKECGSNGCGEECGQCEANETCLGGECLTTVSLSCSEYFDCANECTSSACEDQCKAALGTTAAVEAALVEDCKQDECAVGGTLEDEVLCLEEYCWGELKACYGTECEDHYDCGEELLCKDGLCTILYGRMWWVEMYSATVTETNPNDGNSAWDTFGGMPDPYAILTVDGKTACTTSTSSDTLSPLWKEEGCFVEIWAHTEIGVEVWDEDIASPDWMGGFSFSSGVSPETLKGQGAPFNADDPSYGVQYFELYFMPFFWESE